MPTCLAQLKFSHALRNNDFLFLDKMSMERDEKRENYVKKVSVKTLSCIPMTDMKP